MDHYLLETLNRTTEYIEAHLLEELTLDRISSHVNVSKFHLLRIWKGATSTGLMEYVRRRRIAQSLGDLLHQRHTVEFISSKYSFGCERTYNRVFKDEFGTSPARWRRNPAPLKILDRFNADFMSRAGEGLIFFRSITVVPSFSIAGPEHVIGAEDNLMNQTANKVAVHFFYNGRPRILNPVERDVFIGYTAIPDDYRGYTIYQPSLEIGPASIVPPDMQVRHVKAHRYGVFTYMGPHRPEEISSLSLAPIWRYVSEKWMPTVEFRLEERFHFERVDYSKCSKLYCECDLYYPISLI